MDFRQKFNPLSGTFDLIVDTNLLKIRGVVDETSDLPLSGNAENDCYIVSADDKIYTWNKVASTGLLADWVSVGSVSSIDWTAVANKPAPVTALTGTNTGNETTATIGTLINGATAKTTPVDADFVGLMDSAASNVLKKLSWANIKATLEAYFDGIYEAALGFTPEDVDNKSTNTSLGSSDTLYPTQKAVKDYVDANAALPESLEINALLAAVPALDALALSYQLLVNGAVDAYEDETGIDAATSTNESYDGSTDFYQPTTNITSNTKFISHFDGADAAASATDSSSFAKTITFVGNAQLDTAQSKFGTASLLLDGTGDKVTLADSADWAFGTGPFCIEMFVRYNSIAGTPAWCGQLADNDNFWYFRENNLWMEIANTVIFNYTFSWTPSLNTWYHVAFCWAGGATELKMYVDGVEMSMTASTSISGKTWGDVSAPFIIGDSSVADNDPLNGWIDEVRITKGDQVYTGAFTPPSVAFGGRQNMELVSNAFTAQAAPTTARLVVLEEDVDAVTLGTDLKGWVSRDNGTTYSEVTLANKGNYASGTKILSGTVSVAGQPSGTSMKYKLTTHNNKDLKLRGTAISWK